MPVNEIKIIKKSKIDDASEIKKMIKITDAIVKKIRDAEEKEENKEAPINRDISKKLMETNSHYKLILERWNEIREAQTVEELYNILEKNEGLAKLDDTPKNRKFLYLVNEFVEKNNALKQYPRKQRGVYEDFIKYLMNVIHAAEGRRVYDPAHPYRSLGDSKVKDTSIDIYEDLIDRAMMIMEEADYAEDPEEAVRLAIDEGLIYTSDILELADRYGLGNEVLDLYYQDLFEDMYGEVLDRLDDIKEEVEDEEEE